MASAAVREAGLGDTSEEHVGLFLKVSAQKITGTDTHLLSPGTHWGGLLLGPLTSLHVCLWVPAGPGYQQRHPVPRSRVDPGRKHGGEAWA